MQIKSIKKQIVLPINFILINKLKQTITHKLKRKPSIMLPVLNKFIFKPRELMIKENIASIKPIIKKLYTKKTLFFIKETTTAPKLKFIMKKRNNNILFIKNNLEKKPLGIIYANIIKEAEKIVIDFDILKYIKAKKTKSKKLDFIKKDCNGIYLNLYNLNDSLTTSIVIKYGLNVMYEKSTVLIKKGSKKIFVKEFNGCLEPLIYKVLN
ncbi:hypothetical protein CDIK_0334 [Cucumispora dikerogammari]|nr:hypothetical protein CDIK_0334 [Cucumispora dikerogammari]